ncbi:hypothetical protein GCM10023075_08270 [Streptosporangium album]
MAGDCGAVGSPAEHPDDTAVDAIATHITVQPNRDTTTPRNLKMNVPIFPEVPMVTFVRWVWRALFLKLSQYPAGRTSPVSYA